MRDLLKFATAASRAFKKFLIATSLGALVSACATEHAIVTGSVAYNNALADSQNKLILLNAVRAAHRYPMYFSSVGSVTSKNESSAEAAFAIPFGPNVTTSNTVTPKVTVNGGSSTIGYANLNSGEFARNAFFK